MEVSGESTAVAKAGNFDLLQRMRAGTNVKDVVNEKAVLPAKKRVQLEMFLFAGLFH